MNTKSPEVAASRDSLTYYPAGVSDMHKACWEFLHFDIIDKMATELVEQTLKEHNAAVYKLLNDFVVVQPFFQIFVANNYNLLDLSNRHAYLQWMTSFKTSQ